MLGFILFVLNLVVWAGVREFALDKAYNAGCGLVVDFLIILGCVAFTIISILIGA